MKWRLVVVAFFFVFWVISCQPASSGQVTALPSEAQENQSLTVFAAAALADVFNEVQDAFEASHPGVNVLYNFAGSQQLAQQLALGAPADVFASGNEKQIQEAVKASRVDPAKVQKLAGNRLIIIYPTGGQTKIHQIQDLAKPGLKVVLADDAAPAGQYALEFLDKASQERALGAGFKESVLENVVSYEENVRAVLTKVVLGEADAGIVYPTDVGKDTRDKVGVLEIPDELNVMVDFYIAPISDSSVSQLSQEFITFLLSEEGQGILSRYNFLPVQ